MFTNPSILKNTSHLDLNDRNNINARFIQLAQIDSHSTAKLYVDNSIDEPSLVRNIHDNGFNNFNISNINSITLNTQAANDNQVITKAYVGQFHQNKERSRRDLGIDFYNQSSDLVKDNQNNDFNDNKLTNKDSITVNKNPTLCNEVPCKKNVDYSIRDGNVLRFNQTLENYSRVSVGNDIFILTK